MNARCLICGSAERTEEHHIALAVNLTVTVTLCRSCHQHQSRLQRDAGIFRRLHGDEQRVCAIMHGFLALVGEHAKSVGCRDQQVTRSRAAALQLLSAISDDVGPDPTAATINRPEREPRRAAGTPIEFATGLLDALASAADEWLPGSQVADLAAGLADSVDALYALSEHPRADEITAAIEGATEATIAAVQQVASALEQSLNPENQ